MADSVEDEARETLAENPIMDKPGLDLPLTNMPYGHFPLMSMATDYPGPGDDCWQAPYLYDRERYMMRLINELSDKPEWWRMVQDDAIATQWKQEALAREWTEYPVDTNPADFTEAMANVCINELRRKAELYDKTGLVPVYDYVTAVVKSDTAMTPELAASLCEAVKPLKNIPPEAKDRHPEGNHEVLNLVHPSLWPLMYGRTRYLPDRVIGIEDALAHCGAGTVLPVPDSRETECDTRRAYINDVEVINILSNKFQWLPFDVNLDPATGSATIASYINNLHPEEHASLYPVIGAFIEKSLPAWDVLYRWRDDFAVVPRIRSDDADVAECLCPEICNPYNKEVSECKPSNRPMEEVEEHANDNHDEDDEDDEDDDGEDVGESKCEHSAGKDSESDDSSNDESDGHWSGEDESQDTLRRLYYIQFYKKTPKKDLDHDWFVWKHKMKHPDADPTVKDSVGITAKDVKTSGFFCGKKQIQVIVKLANIHLTPGENSFYPGGSWHTEGSLNEHIIATALYCYDSENIADCTLDFLACANKNVRHDGNVDYVQHFTRYYNSMNRENLDVSCFDGRQMQHLGSVRADGRALFFPNTVESRLPPFKLADPEKPGHMKMLTLLLVDPEIPIISTSNVPPQQRHWWLAQTGLTKGRGVLPPEVMEQVLDEMDWPIGREEAEKLRLELMAHRTWTKVEGEEWYDRLDYYDNSP